MGTNTDLYAYDFYAWSQTTATLIRQGKWSEIDPEAVAEELESLGKRDKRELESRLEVLLRHLLKWRYQPQRWARGQSWRSTILEQRRRLTRLLQESPSLRSSLDQTIQDEYPHARQRAIAETRLPAVTFPIVCPWNTAQLTDADFWPEE